MTGTTTIKPSPAREGRNFTSHLAKHDWLLGTASRVAPYLARLAMAGIVVGVSSGVASAQTIDPNALPQGAHVVAGAATISQTASNYLVVRQNSQRTVIDWNSFNIGANATTEFRQPNASSIAVNRVTGGTDPTQIMGTLKSNGQVMVLDPNGVLTGPNSRMDVGGIIASTGNIDVNQFMSGAHTVDITGMTEGTVENRGRITVRDGGLAALVAPHAINSGVITATWGRVELASGSAVALDLYGDSLISLAVTGEIADALVENTGMVTANGGYIAMTARAAEGVVDDVINMSGILRADTIGSTEGKIVLKGHDNGTVHVSGEIDAVGNDGNWLSWLFGGAEKGGYTEITGNSVFLDGAEVDVSGYRAGGTAFIGGGLFGNLEGVTAADFTEVSADSIIHADATGYGNGGTAVIWGNRTSAFYGTATARGGAYSGNGGLVEVSTGEGVIFEGMVDTSAARGTKGTLLIDPASVVIGNEPSQPGGAYLNAQNLANALASTTINIVATENIDIAETIDLSFSQTSQSPGIGDFILDAPTVNVNGDVLLSSHSFVRMMAQTLNLNGQFYSGGVLSPQQKLVSHLTARGDLNVVNVLSPAASIQQAIYFASPRQPTTINVAPGTYSGQYTITKPVILQGLPGDETVAGPDAGAPSISGAAENGTIFAVTAPNVTITGFNFNGTVNGGALGDSFYAVQATGANNLEITNNDFNGFDQSAVAVSSSDGVNISYNTLANVGAGTITTTGVTNEIIGNNVVTDGSDQPPGGGDDGGGDTGGGDTGGGDDDGAGNGGGHNHHGHKLKSFLKKLFFIKHHFKIKHYGNKGHGFPKQGFKNHKAGGGGGNWGGKHH